jgi:hypothetical protein
MKKTILSLFLMLLISLPVLAQPKVNISVTNFGLSGSFYKGDVMATVPAGQSWKVGSSNIRINWASTPGMSVSIKTDNPVINQHPGLSSGNYAPMTTTSISGGTAISLNISRTGNCLVLSPGTYKLGEIRFNRLDTTGCVKLTILPSSVLQDSITQLTNPAGWTLTTDTTCKSIVFVGIASIEELPTVFKLYTNYPNPFNPSTTIKYDVPNNSFVKLTIFDILGREVDQLVNQNMTPGRYDVQWDAKSYASGTYLYKLEAGDFVDIKKMILVK